jgi:LysM repeat protein
MRKIILLLLTLFMAVPQRARAEEIFQEIVVAPGDTMWSIANKYLKDPQRWPDIVKYNNLPTPDPTIALPGTRIRVPMTLVKEEFRNAELMGMTPVVKYKRKGTEDWKEANPNMTLKYEDALRTLKGAQARVRFPSREVVVINENSYVVLKPEKILQEIQLLQGDVRASRAKVILPQGTVVNPRNGDSDFQAKVREDQTEVVFVYKGKVDVTAQGKTVTVPEGFGTEVPKSAPPLTPQPLKTFKDFNPADMTTAPSKDVMMPSSEGVKVRPPSMTGAADKKPSSSKSLISDSMLANYHMQISPDPSFKTVIIEKTQSIGDGFDVRKQSIPDGTYYMRVAFIDALGVKGPFSEPSVVIKDTQPPQIENLLPEDGRSYEGDDVYADVGGTVHGATLISVNDDVVFVSSSGRFDKSVHLKPGINVLRIYAKDAAGNEVTITRKVSYKE